VKILQTHGRRLCALVGLPRVSAAVPRGAALIASLAEPSAALAQDNVVGTGTLTLPRDLSPWGMYLNADPVVQAVLIGLAFASVVTWTVWLAKSIEIFFAKRRVQTALNKLAGIRSTLEDMERLAGIQGEIGQFLAAAATELKLSPGSTDKEGIKERIASRLERLEAGYARRILRGTGVLATIGATAPFVGLFGTVWGIMNSFIGISKAHTTNLAAGVRTHFRKIPKTFFASARSVHLTSRPKCSARVLPAHKSPAGGNRARERQPARSEN
jgi:biopolymer transport protein ExbB